MQSPSAKFLLRTSLIFITLGFYACQNDGYSCEPGFTRSCVDDNGCIGQESCAADGSAFQSCVCDSDTSTTDDPTTSSDSSTDDETTTETTSAGGMGGDGGASMGGSRGAVDEEHGNVIFNGTGTSVSSSDNDFGIQGAFYVRQDSYRQGQPKQDDLTHSSVEPISFSKRDDKPCINGEIARVDGGQWSEVWGVLLGLELAKSGKTWDATQHDIEGFAFKLSGSVGDARLRFEAKVRGSDENFCAMLEHDQGETGSFTVALEDIEHDCFGDGGNMSFDPSQLEAIEWLAMADDGSNSPVEDFCVERVEVY